LDFLKSKVDNTCTNYPSDTNEFAVCVWMVSVYFILLQHIVNSMSVQSILFMHHL